MRDPKHLKPGEEQHEQFHSANLCARAGREDCDCAEARRVQYDYREEDGTLFSTVKPTLAECREARDAWQREREGRDYGRLLGRLAEGRPVFVRLHDGREVQVWSMQMQGPAPTGFRTIGDGNVIAIEEIKSVTFQPARETLALDRLSASIGVGTPPEDLFAFNPGLLFKAGELRAVENPLPYGMRLPAAALSFIGSANLPATELAEAGYRVTYYRLAEGHTHRLPYPFLIHVESGPNFWQLFADDERDLCEFRDRNTPDCAVEGVPYPAAVEDFTEGKPAS